MYVQRLARLQAELRERQIDCLALLPGPNLRYMTGLDFHLMERPTVGFIPADGTPVFAIPSLEEAKFDAACPFDAEKFTYTDEHGPTETFRRAVMALPEVHSIAVEHLTMRVMELKLVQRHVPNAILHDANPVMDVLRQVKDAAEVECMRQAIAITEQALQTVIDAVHPGMTEAWIARQLRLALIEAGGGPLPFEPIVLAGPNAAHPHGVPSDRAVQSGEVLLIDFGTSHQGYVSDITRTFAVEQPLEGRHRDIYEVVKAANAAGVAAARPGVTCQDVDRAARRVIDEAGYGALFVHRTGHGIGLDEHERPYIVKGNETVLEPGMTFTVEPGIYLPGEIGVRIEDDVLVTRDGAESLTQFTRDLLVVGHG